MVSIMVPKEAANAAQKRGPTIYDVAAASDVAASTVSRAFSRPGRVNAETAERIHRIADELGYRRNSAPRSGAQGSSTRLIAFLTADVANSFFLEIVRGAQTAAARSGQLLLIVDTQESGEVERAVLERLLPIVDGVILATSRMSDTAIRMVTARRPTVLINRPMADVPSLVTDNVSGMRAAINHLADLGHSNITYVAGPEASWADSMRWAAARRMASERDVRIRRIGPFPPTLAGGVAAADVLQKKLTSAVVGYNDLLALGMIKGLDDLGLEVPGDVSVVGFDNIVIAADWAPGLTTVAAPLEMLGSAAVEMLLSQKNSRWPRKGSAVAARSATIPARLIIRGSTGVAPS